MRHTLHFPVKPRYGFSDMIARGAAAAPVPSADFMLWNTLEKGQIKHFLFLNRQTREGGGKQLVIENDRIAADGKRIFPAEIIICRTEWIKFFFCELFKGYFSLVFPAPCPQSVVFGVSDNDFTKSMECIFDMLLVFFCASHRNSPFPPQRAVVG